MKTWVKLYTEINWDPKIGTLSWAHRGLWCSLLALAGEIDARDGDESETGELDTIENTAWRLRCDLVEFREMLAAFLERGIVAERNSILFVTHYGTRQAVPPSQTRPANRDRQREHRMSQVSHNAVTTQNRIDPDPDPDPDPTTAAGPESPSDNSNGETAALYALIDRSGVIVASALQAQEWDNLLDITKDMGLIGEAFQDCAAQRKLPSPKYIRAILERCLADGTRPGVKHRNDGPSPPRGKSSTEMLDDWYEQEKRKEAARGSR